MQANKVILNNEVLIDLTADTATETDVLSGVVFHKADGTTAVGTIEEWNGTGVVTAPITDLIVTIDSTTYSILPSMTWYEWANNTEYNTGGFVCNAEGDNVRVNGTSDYIADAEGNAVYGDDIIVIGSTYKTKAPASLLSSDGSKIVDASGLILTLKE